MILSAQATDKSVNRATSKLFPVANTPQAILDLGETGLADYIKDNRVDMLFGCAGIEMHDGGTQIQTQAIMNRVRNTRRCRWLSGSHP